MLDKLTLRIERGRHMFMLELLKDISNLGSAEAENLLVSAGESTLKKMKSAHEWKKY